MSNSKVPASTYFTSQLWSSNQVLVAVLGICSALGVTNRLSVAITMGLSVSFVTAFSSFFVSLLRKVTPDSVRMITQLAIISVFVIIIDQFLQAYFFSISKVLSVFVGLIITNCIVMGRTEGMAKNVEPLPAFLDGLGAGMGYAFVLIIVAFIRELFGFGQLLGYQVIPLSWYATSANPDGYDNFILMVSPPAAFFIIGGLIYLSRKIQGT
ncbi:MAG: NADH:ubiquinone reductase (Na(+)-transporting) subunit D [Parachlamydiaceae bacterium]|nr:NADH:ubiquinone reductase (Na(+)-transporting) subunit D [Parachlamydiaceae bacterium]